MAKFSIYAPVAPFSINQGFGGNAAYYQTHGINIVGHNGWDLQAKHGQPIYASHDGMAYYEVDGNQGHGVVLITNEPFDYEGESVYFKTIYWHMCDSTKEPQFKSPIEDNYPVQVKAGDLLGYADNTGLSQGDHVHWGVKPVAKSGEAPFSWFNVSQNNGYGGAIDPTPYFNGLLAEDINYKHTFYTYLNKNDSGPEVAALQRCLRALGYFPAKTELNGIYGPITAGAVFNFQKKYVITGPVSFVQVWGLMGSRVGPLTVTALNKLFAS